MATWEKGRQLKTFGANKYWYDKDGIRIKKQTSTTIHEYTLDGTNIIKETVTDNCNCPKYVNEYLYDLDGTVCGLKHDGVAYYFYKNLQGDVIAITDDTGATVAIYTYDAWGKVTIVNYTSGINIAITPCFSITYGAVSYILTKQAVIPNFIFAISFNMFLAVTTFTSNFFEETIESLSIGIIIFIISTASSFISKFIVFCFANHKEKNNKSPRKIDKKQF